MPAKAQLGPRRRKPQASFQERACLPAKQPFRVGCKALRLAGPLRTRGGRGECRRSHSQSPVALTGGSASGNWK